MTRAALMTTASLLAVLGATAASGAVVASDDFTYADGALNGNNGGVGWAGAWDYRGDLAGNNVVDATDAVTGGVATVSGDNSGVFDDQGASFRTMSSTLSTGSVWISVDMAFTQGSATNAFINFNAILGTPPATGDPTGGGAWRVGQEWSASDWSIAGLDATGVATSTDINSLDTVLINIDFDAGTTSMWVNAVDGVALGTADATANVTPGAFDTIMIRSGGNGTVTRTAALDTLIIGTEEADVRVVPEPGSLALLGLGGLMIARRRRG